MLGMWFGFYDNWKLRANCAFDGVNKLIYINEGITNFDIKIDLYSAAKEWAQADDNSKYLFPIRTIGGDPTVTGQFAGDIYFLQNGWRLVADFETTAITGVLFSDDFDTAYLSPSLNPIYPAIVSSTVNTVEAGGTGGLTAEQDALLTAIASSVAGEDLLTIGKFLALK